MESASHTDLAKLSIIELLTLKEKYRSEHGLYIENNMDERGAMNGKTEQYFTVHFTKRITHPSKKGMKWNARSSWQTFKTYRKALEFALEQADYVLKGFDEQDQKNKEKFIKPLA